MIAIAAVIAPQPAAAWDGTPKALAARVGAATAPGCDVCHRAEAAPVGAADQPFAKALVARGLDADGAAPIDRAIAKMRADKVDSDGDGAQDLDEVAWGADPNRADVPEAQGEAPQYGCAARAPAEGAAGWAAIGLVVAAALAGRARARGLRTRAR